MDENNGYNPSAIDLSQQAAASPMPELTLNYSEPQQAASQPQPMQLQQQAAQAAVDTSLDESKLSPEEQKMVSDFSKKIDIKDSTMVMTYGGTAQQKCHKYNNQRIAP